MVRHRDGLKPSSAGRVPCGVIAVGRVRRRRVLHDVPGAAQMRIVAATRVAMRG
jgi:hypothetical protein